MTITNKLKKLKLIKHLPPVDAAYVLPNLFISDVESIDGLITAEYIQSIVCCAADVQLPLKMIAKKKIFLYKLPVMYDMKFNKEQPKNQFFKLITVGRNAIEHALANKRGPVLVHCAKGINRSASVLAAWLLTRPKSPLSYKKTIEILEAANAKRGWCILTNSSFRQALSEYADWYKQHYNNKT
jgi:hypothetical protein